jgi:hypothetical protein
MFKANYVQILAILIILSIAITVISPKVVAQSSNSNATATSDSIEKLFSKASSSKMTLGKQATQETQANNYSVWLLICKAPPITNVESQCDTPAQLH